MNIKVRGGQVLSGEIYPSGSKNAAVALIPASILLKGKTTFENIPDITDVVRLVKIMEKLGSEIGWNKSTRVMVIDNSDLSFNRLTKEDVGNMRGSSLFWGPMLGRFRKVAFEDLPGGCTLGIRLPDPHYDAFRGLGVMVNQSDTGVAMDASKARGAEIWLTEMSPTATENAIMLAVTISGKTRIIGAASEPNVQDLCNFLNKAGARITGIGSSILEIDGYHPLHSIRHTVVSDHYEIATFLAMGAVTGGQVQVHNAIPEHFKMINREFAKFGIKIEYRGTTAIVNPKQKIEIEETGNHPLIVRAQPWPALPVDMLPLFIPLALVSRGGQVLFHNWMYEAGLFWTSELQKMGANVTMCDPHRVIVAAGNKLRGATIEAPYIIRAVVAFVMAAMVAEGESLILNADALYRGHPHFSDNLKKLGAVIEEVD
jgi:UDP-N-acetylglucosamine 1-carboxyvinyltransferase